VWGTNGGVYLGYGTDRTEGDPPASAPVIQYAGDRHLMTIGHAGSGISRRLLQPNILALGNWSMVVVDTTGEMAALCARRRDPELQQTIVLDPFGVSGLAARGFDPVAALDPESPAFADDALELAEALIRPDGSVRDLVTALIMYARLSGAGLAGVRECLGSFPGVADRLAVTAEEFDWPELAVKAAACADGDVSRALTETRWLDNRAIKADLASHVPVDFGTLREAPTTVFLVLPARRLASHAAWLRVVIASVLQALMRDGGVPKVPVMLLLDQYPALVGGGFPILESNLSTLAAHGVKLWTVWQDLAQARTLYGDGFESFVSGCGVLQAFAPQDVVTAEYLSQRTGLTAVEVEARSRTVNLGPGMAAQSHGGTVSYQPVPRMLAQDLRNMQEGFSVIFSHKVRNTIRAYLPLPAAAPARRRSFFGGRG
jgi:type IV secretion system protein VirD4